MENFKVKCVDARGQKCYTTGKVYDITDSTLANDYGSRLFTGRIDSIDDLRYYSYAEWELVDDYKEEDNMSGNFKVRCVDTRGQSCYTKGKVYEITDNTLTNDYGHSVFTKMIKSFKDLEMCSRAKWELVEEKENDIMNGNFEDLKKYGTAKLISKQEEDVVNQPSHYLSSSLECIQAMEMAFGIEVVYNFCICNAWKYLWRYKSKNGKQDVAKARWYIDKAKSYNHYEVQHDNIEKVLIEIEKEVE